MSYSGIYFDGKSSKPYEVDVQKSGNNISIRHKDSWQNQRSWLIDKCEINSFNSADELSIRYGEFPYEILELKDEAARFFGGHLKDEQNTIGKTYSSVLKADPKLLVIGGFAVLFSVLFVYFKWASPFIGEKAVVLIPKEMEKKIGDNAFNQMTSVFGVDTSASKTLQEFYHACGFQSEYDIEVFYSDSDIVNAFAVPGGKIVVFKGLIDETKCWDELAALLAHEQAHVDQRHSLKNITRALSSYLVLSVLTGDVAGVSGIILENLNQLQQLSNSREFEKEADMVGMQNLRDLGIRPSAMRDLFERFLEIQNIFDLKDDDNDDGIDQVVGKGEVADTLIGEEDKGIRFDSILKKIERSSEGLEILSTHPLSKNRIKYIEDLIENNSSYNISPKDNLRAEELWLELKEKSPQSEERRLFDFDLN